jgi:hypothetical protein
MHNEELKRIFPLIELLARVCDKDREIIISFLNEEGCDAMYECVHNGLYNKEIPYSERKCIYNAICKNEEEYVYLNKLNASPRKKHEHLIKVCDSAGVILKSIAPLLQNILEQSENESL